MIVLLFLLMVPPVPGDYRLQIGDEIAITVSGKMNFTYSQKISPEGNVFIQSGGLALWSPEKGEIVPAGATVLGIVKIFDLTSKEATEVARKEFGKYFKNISVSITLVGFDDVVYVEGAVVVPGAYPFFPGRTARDYIGLAGGPLRSGNLKDMKIITHENKVINGDLDAILLRNSVINVPEDVVYVQGAVRYPRAYPFFPERTARDYIGLAGGPLQSGNIKGIEIITPDNGIINGNLDAIPPRNSVINVPQSRIYNWKDYVAILGGISSIVYFITLSKETWEELK